MYKELWLNKFNASCYLICLHKKEGNTHTTSFVIGPVSSFTYTRRSVGLTKPQLQFTLLSQWRIGFAKPYFEKVIFTSLAYMRRMEALILLSKNDGRTHKTSSAIGPITSFAYPGMRVGLTKPQLWLVLFTHWRIGLTKPQLE